MKPNLPIKTNGRVVYRESAISINLHPKAVIGLFVLMWLLFGSRCHAQAFLVKDIALTQLDTVGSSPTSFVSVGGNVFYFKANDGVHGTELWRSDGTSAGTMMVADIFSSTNASADPASLVNVNGTLFFTATESIHGRELWKSDGTAAGTVLVKDILAGTASSNPTNLTAVGSTLFFQANNGANGIELWRSDGTTNGTRIVRDILVGSGSSNPQNLVSFQNSLFFSANNNTNGIELWKSDGTTNGTVLVRDIFPGTSSSAPQNLVVVSNTLFFTANNGTNGIELWKSDGTPGGTVLVRDVNPGGTSSAPQNLTAVGGTLFFSALGSSGGVTNGIELWKSDGTANGTVLAKDIAPGPANSSPASLVNINGILYFTAINSTSGRELWRSDGTSNGTFMVQDILSGSGSSNPTNLVNVNGTLFFSANDGVTGTELWESFSASNMVMRVKDIRPGSFSSNPQGLANINGTLIFSADDGFFGRELWKSDGTAAGTVMIADIHAGPIASSNPGNLFVFNELLYFSADDGTGASQELWASDGVAAGTQPFRPQGFPITFPENFTAAGNSFYFSGFANSNGASLWISDGTDDGTRQLGFANFSAPFGARSPQNLVYADGLLYFSAFDSILGNELCESDGTDEGTFVIQDINPSGDSNPAYLTIVNGTLFFSADDGIHGRKLWKFDGTTAMPVQNLSISNGLAGDPESLVNVNGELFFTATDSHGTELWKSDGTAAGTVIVKDIVPGSGSSGPEGLVALGGTLFFTAVDGVHGRELWKSDGTAAGTVIVADLNTTFAGASSTPQNLTAGNGILFFTARASGAGTNTELWESDGTAGGTMMVADINPTGFASSNPADLRFIDGTLYFSADDGVDGIELWRSDGTAEGTFMAADITDDFNSSSPGPVTLLGNTLYFAAQTTAVGRELFGLVINHSPYVVNEIPDQAGVYGSAFNLALPPDTFADDDFGQTLTYSATDLPSGISFDGNTFTGTFAAAGQFTVTVTATDNGPDPLSTSTSFNITVDKATPVVVWQNPAAIVYGAPLGAGQLNATANAPGTFIYNPPAGTILNAGANQPLSASFVPADPANYNATGASVVISVSKATPAISWANPADIVYGTALGGSQLNATANTPGTFTYSPAAGTILNAGANQVLSVSFAANDTTNYNNATATATLNVLKAPLTATAANKSRPYGAANPALTINYTGFVNGEGAGVIDSQPVAATTATAASPVGAYPITLTGGSDNNYNLTLVNGTLTVTPAPLTVTADSASRMYGQPNPTFTGSITGIQNNDNITATYSCVATIASLVGTYAIVPAPVDPDGKLGNYSVTLNNGALTVTLAPLTVTITGPPSGFVQSVNTNIQFTGTFTKSGASDSYLAYWTFSTDGASSVVVPGTVSNGTVQCTVSFAMAGVYTVALTVTNESGPVATATTVNNDLPAYVVIYNPDGGFVTGGGWINSPAGAYTLDTNLVGRATFGFVSKYEKGATVPTGQTQFRFQIADLDFHSTSYDWLVVGGAKAQYKGSGIINGDGDYGFILTAIDGQLNGGGNIDKFRIKIWEKESGLIVYDNQLGAADSSDPSTAIQGGSIVIHK